MSFRAKRGIAWAISLPRSVILSEAKDPGKKKVRVRAQILKQVQDDKRRAQILKQVQDDKK